MRFQQPHASVFIINEALSCKITGKKWSYCSSYPKPGKTCHIKKKTCWHQFYWCYFILAHVALEKSKLKLNGSFELISSYLKGGGTRKLSDKIFCKVPPPPPQKKNPHPKINFFTEIAD